MLKKENAVSLGMERKETKVMKAIGTKVAGMKEWFNKIKKKIPEIFSQIEGVLHSNLVTFEASKKLQESPDLNKFSEIVAQEIVKKIPHINDNNVQQLIKKDKSSDSLLQILTKTIGDIGGGKEYTKIKKEKLFKKILIANRGEIALRVIRACRELDIESLQIYTKPDAGSLAVKFADRSIKLGNNAADYLNMQKIIKIAKKYKIDAIHPGYGFLAENAEFARICEENKIKFIGPSAKAIQAMGDKINAKKLITAAGVPILEGIEKPVETIEEGKSIAKEIGYPIIIKASAGGGGKGMRMVKNENEFDEHFKACQTEAEASFKNKNVFIEKYMRDPRHIEFQILVDQKGNVIHLGERDCSIQRRHQKLIEEAPSPALTAELREKMGQAALKVASVIEYEGAGTVEFLLDKEGDFYFMEMNTRIQVEHGITELITGIDLVKEQIKVAAGAELAYKQEDIAINGWAIECRINAECPFDDFCPETGKVMNYLPPGGPGIRVCSSCQSGQEVSPHYDSMLAKLMCTGKTRGEAIERMKRALEEFIIEGIDTTIPFHKVVLNTKAFLKGEVTTSFIEKHKIMEKLRKEFTQRKKHLNREEKAIVISTAVAEYLKKKNRFNDKNNPWVNVARREAAFYE